MSALTHRDLNAQPTSNPSVGEKHVVAGAENRPQEAQHKRLLGQEAAGDKESSGAYVSPSDAILSPATQKLAGFKQRQINKQNGKTSTSRMLFAKTPANGSIDDAGTNGEK